ncbi:MAG: 3-methyl-2-oxobutanoate hydroxymethyltransferase [Methanocellales archaeon]|nr:3-methyl-2-oxobutanoate hydroxymethyltransferase [Methanocellales archaeon]MDD3421728.1 3-methyl-2-oxobutanoate hydroxymethyltransferase [Methanocellales archaeon]MDD4898312.1 3-methyl-2-oxobutanoate hydroxymethyltransferase [Methanocellales archaeon]MDD5447424.1 3-methyl-2-oxobutanoate hydroxymethyltransferase [Methanocellales archaeon]
MKRDKILVTRLMEMKRSGKKITMLTAYDYPLAQILDEAGIDILLVGDSLGNVVLGYESTIPVTMEDIIHHTKAVSRGVKNALVVSDMPFMSYFSAEEALRNSGRLIQAGAEAVKLEGGLAFEDKIKALTEVGIPVMGHIGLMPQSIHQMGGYKVQGKTPEAAKKILNDAKAVERAGAFSIILEGVPSNLAKNITEELKVPTIGCGAGIHCDGQVLVTHDILGFYDFAPRFVKRYANLRSVISEASRKYKEEVEGGAFPTDEYSYL